MNETWRQVVPVLISIVILIVIAIVRASSKTLAAIISTMPVTIVLSLWIVYAAEGGDQASVVNYTRSMVNEEVLTDPGAVSVERERQGNLP